ncbi:Cleavage polyadenylation factor subunit clp1, partial [Spiromyces aspiralis]
MDTELPARDPVSELTSHTFSGAWHVANVTKQWTLNPSEEFRFEVDIKQGVKVKLLKGTAEIYGAEMGSAKTYYFTATKLAVFTWEGYKYPPGNMVTEEGTVFESELGRATNGKDCGIPAITVRGGYVQGNCSAEYVAEETPLTTYLNVHCALHQRRVDALSGSGDNVRGPRVVIVGSQDSGKTTLARTLLNYAVRHEFDPLFIDLDLSEGSVTVPGTISATPITHIIDPEDGFAGYVSASSTAPPETPLVFQYGSTTPKDNPRYFNALIASLARAVGKRMEADKRAQASGMIIDTHDAIGLASNDFLDRILAEFAGKFQYGEIRKKYNEKPTLTILKLPKSGG